MREKLYAGIDNEPHGMNPTARIIRDAWVFGIIPETETCAGWNEGRITDLYGKVSDAWEAHGHLVSKLPPELRERHTRIYEAAVAHARQQGWDPDDDLKDDD